ncbi:MAG TPA: diguanylate cyclase [Candidatus Dormibacteraeota bacterium]|nr:diguanylate cyclase [Candidatus Dormibacteraeota bacterium]
MSVPAVDIVAAIAAIAIAAIAAIAGSAGYVALIGRRDVRRTTTLVDRLATEGPTPLDAVGRGRIRDRRLRESFERLAAHLSQTMTLATVDPLTQVSNRQAVFGRLEEEVGRAGRYGRPLSVVLADIDHFKRLNDSHGHVAGDRVLHAVAAILRDNVRSVDAVGRYGGEEFLIVLPETDVDAAASLAEKLRRLVASSPIALEDGTRLAVTLSAGVAGGLGPHLRLDALVRDADAALYSAKALGRDQVFVFHEIEEDLPVRRAAISPAAREAAVEVGHAAMRAATDALISALAGRDAWSGQPSTIVAQLSTGLARSMGLPEREIERIRVASLLHDLGKLAIPDDILSKPGQLAEPEWRVVAEHPKIGQVVLEQAGSLRDATAIVLHHHEWFDGRGYPHGLHGEEIPVGARIVAIADAYEAMVAGRPYRGAVTHQAAIAELRRNAGSQFDPDLVDQFTTLFEHGLPWPDALPHTVAGPPAPEAFASDHDRLHARRRRAVRQPRRLVPAAEELPGTGTDGQ